MSKLRFFSSLAVSQFITYRSYIQTLFLSNFQFCFSFLQLVFPFTFHLIRKGSYDAFLNSECSFFVHVWPLFPQLLPSATCFCAINNRGTSVSFSPYIRHLLLSVRPITTLNFQVPNLNHALLLLPFTLQHDV